MPPAWPDSPGASGGAEAVILDDPAAPAIGGILAIVDKTSLVERAREEVPDEDGGARYSWVAEAAAPAPANITESNDVLAVDGTEGDRLSLPFKLDVPVPGPLIE